MFLDELQPVVKELIQQQIAFFGGFASGLLRLKLSDNPLKKWLEQQGLVSFKDNNQDNGNSRQSISDRFRDRGLAVGDEGLLPSPTPPVYHPISLTFG
jgi:hypothetical protein